jgi:hypothetical protein
MVAHFCVTSGARTKGWAHGLFNDAPDAEPNENVQFRFNVAFYEPQIIVAQSLRETVHELTTLVERIVAALAPRLN